MELALLLYAASVAENVKSILVPFVYVFGVLSLATAVGSLIAGACLEHPNEFTLAEQNNEFVTPHDKGDRDFQTNRKISRVCRRLSLWFIAGWFITFGLSALIPKKADVYVIAGGYVALKAVNSDVVQSTSNSVLSSIETWLDKEQERNRRISEARNKKKEGQ